MLSYMLGGAFAMGKAIPFCLPWWLGLVSSTAMGSQWELKSCCLLAAGASEVCGWLANGYYLFFRSSGAGPNQ